ncbi:MAG: sporulation protein YabP [Eubacteriales bacterium]|nr:sporulation protein YabP [Eubacteriales bacterium]
MASEERNREMPHTIILEGREKLSIAGVLDVQSFDEQQVLLETVRGMLVIRGQGLHVERLQLEAGELLVAGEVGLIEYDDSAQPRGSFWGRLLGSR